jgi:hypothetical protein
MSGTASAGRNVVELEETQRARNEERDSLLIKYVVSLSCHVMSCHVMSCYVMLCYVEGVMCLQRSVVAREHMHACMLRCMLAGTFIHTQVYCFLVRSVHVQMYEYGCTRMYVFTHAGTCTTNAGMW